MNEVMTKTMEIFGGGSDSEKRSALVYFIDILGNEASSEQIAKLGRVVDQISHPAIKAGIVALIQDNN
jgi:hypothetical protein